MSCGGGGMPGECTESGGEMGKDHGAWCSSDYVKETLQRIYYTDYLADAVLCWKLGGETDGAWTQLAGAVMYGINLQMDDRVHLMDGWSEVQGDNQNSCVGQLLEPGYYNRMSFAPVEPPWDDQ